MMWCDARLSPHAPLDPPKMSTVLPARGAMESLEPKKVEKFSRTGHSRSVDI